MVSWARSSHSDRWHLYSKQNYSPNIWHLDRLRFVIISTIFILISHFRFDLCVCVCMLRPAAAATACVNITNTYYIYINGCGHRNFFDETKNFTFGFCISIPCLWSFDLFSLLFLSLPFCPLQYDYYFFFFALCILLVFKFSEISCDYYFFSGSACLVVWKPEGRKGSLSGVDVRTCARICDMLRVNFIDIFSSETKKKIEIEKNTHTSHIWMDRGRQGAYAIAMKRKFSRPMYFFFYLGWTRKLYIVKYEFLEWHSHNFRSTERPIHQFAENEHEKFFHRKIRSPPLSVFVLNFGCVSFFCVLFSPFSLHWLHIFTFVAAGCCCCFCGISSL